VFARSCRGEVGPVGPGAYKAGWRNCWGPTIDVSISPKLLARCQLRSTWFRSSAGCSSIAQRHGYSAARSGEVFQQMRNDQVGPSVSVHVVEPGEGHQTRVGYQAENPRWPKRLPRTRGPWPRALACHEPTIAQPVSTITRARYEWSPATARRWKRLSLQVLQGFPQWSPTGTTWFRGW
jgi:hypothetical protein